MNISILQLGLIQFLLWLCQSLKRSSLKILLYRGTLTALHGLCGMALLLLSQSSLIKKPFQHGRVLFHLASTSCVASVQMWRREDSANLGLIQVFQLFGH